MPTEAEAREKWCPHVRAFPDSAYKGQTLTVNGTTTRIIRLVPWKRWREKERK